MLDVAPGSAAEVRLLRQERQLIIRALRELELERDERVRLKQRRNQILEQIAAIDQAEEQEAQRIRDERDRKRKEADDKRKRAEERERQAEERRMRDIRESAERTAERRRELFEGISGRSGTRAGLRALALRHERARLRQEEQQQGLTAQQVRSMQFEFLQQIRGTANQFGGNLFAPGSLQVGGDPRLYSEMRAQTEVLRALASGVRQPGTRYARTELQAAFEGPTF